MRYPRPSPKTGHSLETSSLCEFVNPTSIVGMLTRSSDYCTKYRPELDLVLRDINVTVVRRVSARDII